MNGCYFCNLLQKRVDIFWENDLLYAIFDNCPVSPGHTLIIPKRHVADYAELNETEWKKLKVAIQKVIEIIEKTSLKSVYQQFIKDHETDQSVWFCKNALTHPKINTKPDGYNHGFNDGNAAGRTVNHFHWHVIPRFENDMQNSQGGVRFVIPEMGNYRLSRN